MSSTSGSSSVFNSLPSYPETLDADGSFTPVVNILNNTFNTPTNSSEPPFNKVLIGNSAQNIVGSSSTPYLPSALPAYIPTLYSNVYDIQTNLTNTISMSDVSDNRIYPSVYAVKNYVQSQLSGTERLAANGPVTLKVSTGTSNTILVGADPNLKSSAPNVGVFQDGSNNVITNFFDINNVDTARNGSGKIIINASNLTSTYFMTIQLTGNKYFVANGKKYKTYQFSMYGDALNLCQFINTSGENVFFVLSYGGLFSNQI